MRYSDFGCVAGLRLHLAWQQGMHLECAAIQLPWLRCRGWPRLGCECRPACWGACCGRDQATQYVAMPSAFLTLVSNSLRTKIGKITLPIALDLTSALSNSPRDAFFVRRENTYFSLRRAGIKLNAARRCFSFGHTQPP
jgi:hypothetical protein